MEVQLSPSFHAGKPRLLFDLPFVEPTDVSPDGQRFVAIKEGKPTSVRQINVVLGWQQLVRAAQR